MSSANIAKQKRMLTQANSQLGKVNLVEILDNEQAWMALPKTVRQELYSQLPPPEAGAQPHDVDLNPLHSEFRPYMEDAIANWQQDLREGRESKKWRQEAIEIGKERENGKFDEYSIAHKAEWWGDDESDETEEKTGEHFEPTMASPDSDAIRDAELSSSSRVGDIETIATGMNTASRTLNVEDSSIAVPSEQQSRTLDSLHDDEPEADDAAVVRLDGSKQGEKTDGHVRTGVVVTHGKPS